MPSYEYTAINEKGKRIKGSIDADSIRVARQKLRTKGVFPTDIHEGIQLSQTRTKDVTRYFQASKIGRAELAVATRQLSTLVAAGLPLVGALGALSEQTDSVILKRIIIDVRERVEEGSSLAKALANFPRSFPRLYINMVASGEASGKLDTVLDNLADYLESQIALRRKVRSALLYPCLMFVFCTLVTIVLFVFVVPNVVQIFEKQGATLPLPTQIMIAISNFLIHYWYILLALFIGIPFSIRWYYRQEKGQNSIDRLLLRLPIFGSVYKKVATARVSQTLSTLLNSGVDLLSALDIAKNIVGNIHVQNALEEAKEGVREGRSLASELKTSGIFPNMLSHMIAVGEKSGDLEAMLEKVASSYENDVDATLSGLTSLLEPLMMFFVGGIVLCIVLAVLLPMADLIDVVGA